VRKSTQNFGSLKRENVIREVYVSQSNYVVNVIIELSAQNGVSTTNDTVSGVDLPPHRERSFVVTAI
jgi:hypothetical protein